MPKYLFKARYTAEGARGLLSDGGTGRRSATERAIASAGGTLESFYFAFGGTDVFVIADLPDNTAAASLNLAVAASDTIGSETVVLLTPEEIDEAAGRGPDWRAPGNA
jgi:uncharacterized protein with GYD domain